MYTIFLRYRIKLVYLFFPDRGKATLKLKFNLSKRLPVYQEEGKMMTRIVLHDG